MLLFDKKVGPNYEPFIVAEISCNHNQDFEKVERLIDAAKLAGAHAVKIQYFEPHRIVPPNSDYKLNFGAWEGKNLYELYTETATPYDWLENIFKYGKKINIPVFSSVYDKYGLYKLEELHCPAYKIASFEANDTHLISQVLTTGKPVIISLGLVGEIEIDNLIALATKKHKDDLHRVAFLHCVSNYPARVEEASLQRIRMLKQSCPNIVIGYSDHTCDPLVPALAIGMGASIIEAHLRLDGVYSEDLDFSYSPEQFKNMAQSCKKAYDAVPVFPFNKQHPEYWYLKRSLYVTKPVKKGDAFTHDNVGSYRPYEGINASMLPQIIGRKAKQDIDIWSPLKMEYVE